MRISDWSSDVCSSDPLRLLRLGQRRQAPARRADDDGPGFLRVRKRGGGTGRAHPGSLPRRGGHAALQASAAEGRGHLAQGVRRRIAALGAQPTAEGAHRHLHQNFDWSRVRSEEHTSELQSLMRISYAVFCLKKKTNTKHIKT